MKEFKGTKGEWIAHITEFPFAERAYVRAKNDKGWINLLETNWISNFEEQKANAKLIASAPILLRACEDALICFSTTKDEAVNGIIEQLLNAIKKATE